ncbi:aldehyde dehydrogenase family protein [Leisingera sp. S232]|uniref:aldehyde dehydrogenase family protein n=1 Tax=Leisingera sp. S232 TaxID=3415132 RepID=UPI003C7DC241
MKSSAHTRANAAWSGTSEYRCDICNPATGQVTGKVPMSSKLDADLAVASAPAVLPAWVATSSAKRSVVMIDLACTDGGSRTL